MLTQRQKDVMELVLQGYTPTKIAELLNISKVCVNVHMIHIYERLGIYREKGIDMKVMAIKKYTGAF